MLVESNFCQYFYNRSYSDFQLDIQKTCTINVHFCTLSEFSWSPLLSLSVQIANYDGDSLHSIHLLPLLKMLANIVLC